MIVSLKECLDSVARMRRAKIPVGFVNGCFDGCHAGHGKLVQEAANYCGHLVVAINTDEYCTRFKGQDRPTQKLAERAVAMARLCKRIPATVSIITQFDDSPKNLLSQVRPYVYAIGDDYRGKLTPGAEFATYVHFVERLPGFSTTELAQSAK